MPARVRGRCFALAAVAALTLSTLVVAGTAMAAVDRAFAARFTANTTGDVAIVGNNLLDCPDSAAACAAARTGTGPTVNNNDFTMGYVDVDSDATTFDSSRAVLALPAGAAVLWAGLYWGADSSAGTNGVAAPSAADANTVSFGAPGAGYAAITATQLDADTGNGHDYQGFADVTALVQTAGTGTYTVANVQAGTGADRQAGWALVVAYHDSTLPLRNLTVFDGFAALDGGTPSVSFSVSGFVTPPTGAVHTKIGVVAYEGDLAFTGDSLSLDGTQLSNAVNPVNNVFNSTVSDLGTLVTDGTPSQTNHFGFDADILAADGILANGDTSATLALTTGGEAYYPGVVTFVTDLYAPLIQPVKTVTDLNGGNVEPGDTLEYSILAQNTGHDPAENVVITDPIPTGTTYVPGSLAVVSGANAGAKTDASGDDQAEYVGGSKQVVFRIGTGATAVAGGEILDAGKAGDQSVVRFRVHVDPDVTNGFVIANLATATYHGLTLGAAVSLSASADAPTDVTVSVPAATPTPTATATPTLPATDRAASEAAGGSGLALQLAVGGLLLCALMAMLLARRMRRDEG